MSKEESGENPADDSGGDSAMKSPPPQAFAEGVVQSPPADTTEAAVEDASSGLRRSSVEFAFDFSNPVRSSSDEVSSSEDDDDLGADEDDDDDEDDDGRLDVEEGGELIDEMAMMPPYMLARVDKLRELDFRREEIMEKYLEERTALEQKYAKLCQPLYDRRATVIGGELDSVIDAETDASKAVSDALDVGGESAPGTSGEEVRARDEEREVGIPQFWICAMSHMEPIAELITEADVDCLEHCTDVTCEDHSDGMGFTLKFKFEPNDYFTNDCLIKRYEIPNLLLEDEPILKLVTGCEIDWKPGRSLTHREVQRRQRSKKKPGQIRTVTKLERRDSFFHFFSPPKMPSMEEMDEDQADALEEAFDHDYDVAQAFRSHLIPRAVLWFTGEALDEGPDQEGEVDDEDEEDEDDGNGEGQNALQIG